MEQDCGSASPTAFVLVAAFLGSGTALATASGPSISEFETGLTPGVPLWGITSGLDGNTWFTGEQQRGWQGHARRRHHRVHRGLPHRQPARHSKARRR
jgi:hypothetical protein